MTPTPVTQQREEAVANVEAAFRRHMEANDYAKDLIKRMAFEIVPMVRSALSPAPDAKRDTP